LLFVAGMASGALLVRLGILHRQRRASDAPPA